MAKNSGVYSVDVGDPLSASRLPDIPNAGYATAAQRQLSDAMMFIGRGIERNRLYLLEVVLDGHIKWRKVFKAAYRAVKVEDEHADKLFAWLVQLAGPNPAAQKAILKGQMAQAAQQQWDFRERTKQMFRKARRELHQNIRKEVAEMARRKPHSVS